MDDVRTEIPEEELLDEIDPNDPIEKLVRESVRIGEIAAKRRREKIGPIEEIDALDAESERIWKQAKRLGAPGVTQKNYEDLANAILKACITDYEELLSGSEEDSKKNFELIRDVLEHQQFVKLDMIAQLDHIKYVYENQFIPYVNKHTADIKKDYRAFKKKKFNDREFTVVAKHRCPLCGGALRPWRFHRQYEVIGCTGCHLYV